MGDEPSFLSCSGYNHESDDALFTFRTFTGGQGQEIDEGHLQERCFDLVSHMHSDSMVIPANFRHIFAWRLTKEFYSLDELRNRNCNGKMGKAPLDSFKLGLIRKLVFEYFPPEDINDKSKLWKICSRRIDTGIRLMKMNKKFL